MTASELAETAVLSYILASGRKAQSVGGSGRNDLIPSLCACTSVARAESIVAGEAAKSS
jgi:hypothetical protein